MDPVVLGAGIAGGSGIIGSGLLLRFMFVRIISNEKAIKKLDERVAECEKMNIRIDTKLDNLLEKFDAGTELRKETLRKMDAVEKSITKISQYIDDRNGVDLKT